MRPRAAKSPQYATSNGSVLPWMRYTQEGNSTVPISGTLVLLRKHCLLSARVPPRCSSLPRYHPSIHFSVMELILSRTCGTSADFCESLVSLALRQTACMSKCPRTLQSLPDRTGKMPNKTHIVRFLATPKDVGQTQLLAKSLLNPSA